MADPANNHQVPPSACVLCIVRTFLTFCTLRNDSFPVDAAIIIRRSESWPHYRSVIIRVEFANRVLHFCMQIPDLIRGKMVLIYDPSFRTPKTGSINYKPASFLPLCGFIFLFADKEAIIIS